MNWTVLINQRNRWVAHNFPDPDGSRTPLDSIFGCIEELGELTHAHLKKAQNIRGSNEEHDAKAKDAIGDLTIYLLGVMNWASHEPSSVMVPHGVGTPDSCVLSLAGVVGRLSAYFKSRILTGEQNTPGQMFTDYIDTIVHILRAYCTWQEWDYEDIVLTTWEKVKARDWQANPYDGGEDGPGPVLTDHEPDPEDWAPDAV